MKKSILTSILLAVFYFSITAQVPGYLGKRLFVEYNPEYSIITDQRKALSNIIHNFTLDYVISRRIQIGLDYGLFNSQFFDRTDFYEGRTNVKGSVIGLHTYFYFGENLAPLGFHLGINYKHLRGTYWNPRIDSNVSENTWSYGFLWGYRRVFFDRMTFNTHVGINFNIDANEVDINGFGNSTLTAQDKLYSLYGWNMGFGVGLLLY